MFTHLTSYLKARYLCCVPMTLAGVLVTLSAIYLIVFILICVLYVLRNNHAGLEVIVFIVDIVKR